MRINIRLRLILFTSLMMLLVGSSISYYITLRGHQRMLEMFGTDAMNTSRLVAATLSRDLLPINLEGIQNTLKQAHAIPHITGTLLTDNQGKVLHHITKEHLPTSQQPHDFQSKEVQKVNEWSSNINQGVLIINGPVTNRAGKIEGTLLITFSLKEIDWTVSAMIRSHITIILVCLLIGIFLTIIFSYSFSKPIYTILKAFGEIGKGHLKTRIHLKRNDEFGILANSINKMSRNLNAVTYSKNYVDNILQSIVESLVVVHPDTTVRMVNKATLEMLEYEEEEIYEKTIMDLLPEEDHELFHTSGIMKLIQGKPVQQKETCYIAKSGKRIPVLFSYSIARDLDNQVLCFICVAVNIAERIRHERELIEARKKAEKASVSKGEFLANMSHEIRTPMNGIFGASKLLLEQSINDEARELAEMICNSSESLLTIINDILDFSKIESGNLTIENRPINLYQVITDVYNLLLKSAEKKNIELKLNYPSNTPHYFIGDSSRIRQVLLNLIGNAIKFTDKGGVTIRIESQREKEKLFLLKISIIDSGIGISKSAQKLLFQKFTQADSSISRKYGGTGLGLAISRKLVQLMGGTISLESEAGKGSTFHISILLETIEEEALKKKEKKKAKIKRAYGKKILLVEDNPTNQKVASMLLKKLGLEVIVANHGGEALDKIHMDHFDLIFMDMQMPIMDGVTATKKIRQLAYPLSQMIIIAMTANVMHENRKLCEQAGMNGFISKPIHVEKVVEELDRWLE